MNVFAYCAADFTLATREAAGVEPVTCPPLTMDNLDPRMLSGHDVIYLDLHGEPLSDRLAGSNGLFALSAAQIRSVALDGAIVFAANCFTGDADSPIKSALLDSGAKCVVAGAGKNYSPANGATYGAALLGKTFINLIARGLSPQTALNLAKNRVKADMIYRQLAGQVEIVNADQDALGFQCFWPKA